jgi:hypothetical protein
MAQSTLSVIDGSALLYWQSSDRGSLFDAVSRASDHAAARAKESHYTGSHLYSEGTLAVTLDALALIYYFAIKHLSSKTKFV